MKHPCGELPLEAVVLVDPLHRITAGGPPLASLLARATFKYARNDGSRGTYLPRSAGGKYLPHLTVGAAKFDDLKIIEAEPFDAFTVSTIPDFSRLPGRFALLRAAGSRILRLR